jgi:hypothetical protein
VAFFKQCQTADKAASILDKLKEKKQPKEKKTAHLPVAHSHDSNYQQHCCKNCNYHQSNQRNCNKQQHDSCHQDNQCPNHSCCKELDYKKKSYKNEDECKCDHLKKKKDEIMHNNQSSLLSVDTSSRKGVTPVQGLLLAHTPVFALAQAAATGSMQTIMSPMMTASQAASSSASIHTLRTTTTDASSILKKTILFLPPLPL